MARPWTNSTVDASIPPYDSRNDWYCPAGLAVSGNLLRAGKCEADFTQGRQRPEKDDEPPARASVLSALLAQRSRALAALARLSAFPTVAVRSLLRDTANKAAVSDEFFGALQMLQELSVEVVEHVVELEQELAEARQQDHRRMEEELLAAAPRVHLGAFDELSAGQDYVRSMRSDCTFVARMPLAVALLGNRPSADPFFVGMLAAAAQVPAAAPCAGS